MCMGGPISDRNFEGKSSKIATAYITCTCNDHAYQVCIGGKWESMPTSPRTTSIACNYTMLTAGSKHVSISGAKHELTVPSFLRRVCKWHMWYQQHWYLQQRCHQKNQSKVQKCLENECLSRSNKKR